MKYRMTGAEAKAGETRAAKIQYRTYEYIRPGVIRECTWVEGREGPSHWDVQIWDINPQAKASLG